MEEQTLRVIKVSGNRNRTPSEWQSRQTWPGRRQRNVAKAWKRGVFGLHAGQCVCGLKMNKLISRTSHHLCTFSTSIREIREIKYYFNIWGIRKKKKEGGSEKGGWKFTHFTSPGSAPDFIANLHITETRSILFLTEYDKNNIGRAKAHSKTGFSVNNWKASKTLQRLKLNSDFRLGWTLFKVRKLVSRGQRDPKADCVPLKPR